MYNSLLAYAKNQGITVAHTSNTKDYGRLDRVLLSKEQLLEVLKGSPLLETSLSFVELASLSMSHGVERALMYAYQSGGVTVHVYVPTHNCFWFYGATLTLKDVFESRDYIEIRIFALAEGEEVKTALTFTEIGKFKA
jgi:hypothetical protein